MKGLGAGVVDARGETGMEGVARERAQFFPPVALAEADLLPGRLR